MKRRVHSKMLPIRAMVTGYMIMALISLIMLALLALLVLNGGVGERAAAIALYAIVFIACFAGGLVAVKIGTNKLYYPLILGAVYWVILLLCGMLVFDGRVTNVWQILLAVMLGCGAVCATCMKKPRRKGYKKLRAR